MVERIIHPLIQSTCNWSCGFVLFGWSLLTPEMHSSHSFRSQKSLRGGLQIGSVLRGSSSYKKAKQKQAELLDDDTEVPDSQPADDLWGWTWCGREARTIFSVLSLCVDAPVWWALRTCVVVAEPILLWCETEVQLCNLLMAILLAAAMWKQ